MIRMANPKHLGVWGMRFGDVKAKIRKQYRHSLTFLGNTVPFSINNRTSTMIRYQTNEQSHVGGVQIMWKANDWEECICFDES